MAAPAARTQVQSLPTGRRKKHLRTVYLGKCKKVGCYPTPSQLPSCYQVADLIPDPLAGDD